MCRAVSSASLTAFPKRVGIKGGRGAEQGAVEEVRSLEKGGNDEVELTRGQNHSRCGRQEVQGTEALPAGFGCSSMG